MTRHTHVKGGVTLAPLANLTRLMTLYRRLADRPVQLPGLGVFYGRSGLGKTHAATYLQNKTRGVRIEIGETWTRKTLLSSILRELGVSSPRGTIPDLAEQAIILLADAPERPLIIDEADKLVDKRMIEIVRELFEGSQCPVILIGEEALPKKLEVSERTHNRVLEWTAAEPCSLEDARQLARVTCPGIDISEEMIARVLSESGGITRRVSVNLARLVEWAQTQGVTSVTPKAYDGGYYTGVAPTRRAA